MKPAGDVEELYFSAAAARGPRELVIYPERWGEPHRVDYGRLLELSRGAAAGLEASGLVRPGEPFLVLASSDLPTVTTVLGGLLLGALPTPVSPPMGLGGLDAWQQRLVDISADVGATGVIGPAEFLELLPDGLRATSPAEFPSTGPARPAVPLGTSHVQLTSGSTGHSKGVLIDHANLEANLYQIGWASDLTEDDRVVSWLPLYHDMGLVGALLFSLYWNLDLVLLSPLSFLTKPVRWLEAIAKHRGTLSPAPSFAFPYVAHRLRGRTPDLDLSSWRAAHCGAEPIQPQAIARFTEALAPCGLNPGVILPCYGLAEATLAVSFAPMGRGVCSKAVSRARLTEGVVQDPRGEEDVQELVLLGRPLPEVEVLVRGDDGRPAAPGTTGRVFVRGPTVTPGYLGTPYAIDAEGWLDTGDVGCWIDGELALLGRTKDIIIVRGKNHSPVSLEWAAERVDGVRPGATAAFACFDEDAGTEAAVLACEVAAEESDWTRGAIGRSIQESVLRHGGLRPSAVVLVAPGAIPKTTSGKVRRARTRELYMAGQLGSIS